MYVALNDNGKLFHQYFDNLGRLIYDPSIKEIWNPTHSHHNQLELSIRIWGQHPCCFLSICLSLYVCVWALSSLMALYGDWHALMWLEFVTLHFQTCLFPPGPNEQRRMLIAGLWCWLLSLSTAVSCKMCLGWSVWAAPVDTIMHNYTLFVWSTLCFRVSVVQCHTFPL